jgi:DNA-binding response OmpR family regulator
MRILIVEDEYKIANAVKRGLEQQSYAVDVAYNGDDGLAMANSGEYDLIILDRMLPGTIDGMGILKKLREDKNTCPILILTAKDKILDKAQGLNLGADDYLVKPFAFVELIARVRALLRRPKQAVDSAINYEDLKLDPEAFLVKRKGKNIDLTTKEFALLEYFMRNPDRILTKDMIMRHVWDYDSDILPNTIEVYIGYLRNKIDKPFKEPNLLHTRRGFGYIFGVRNETA